MKERYYSSSLVHNLKREYLVSHLKNIQYCLIKNIPFLSGSEIVWSTKLTFVVFD